MTQVTINNTPVSITLTNGESTTVPSGETWKVTITHANKGGSYNRYSYVTVNGDEVIGHATTDRDYHAHGSRCVEVVLTGGDTVACNIEANANSAGAHISGFKL